MAYTKTRKALDVLETSLSCTQCKKLHPTLCTLGACDHLFCRDCCTSFLGAVCPACQIPAHVKDAQVNRQLSNLVSLCKELGRILTCNQDKTGSGTIAQDADQSIQDLQESTPQSWQLKLLSNTTATVSVNKVKVTGRGDQTLSDETGSHVGRSLRRKKQTSKPTRLRQSVETEQRDDDGTRETRSGRSRSRRGQRKTQDAPVEDGDSGGKTMDGGAEGKVENSRSVSRNRRGDRNESEKKLRGVPPSEQTTLTHLYDEAVDESGGSTLAGETGRGRKRGRPRKGVHTPVREGSRSSSRQTKVKPADQSTMTQFYDYDDEELPLLDMDDDTDSNVTTNSNPGKSGPARKASKESRNGRGRPHKQTSNPSSPSSFGTPESGETGQSADQRKRGRKCVKSKEKTSPVFQQSPRKKGKRDLDSSLVESNTGHSRLNARGETQLHVAAIKGDVDRVMTLLESGAGPNVRDNAGWTPLHECCNHGHAAIAEMLLNHGAMINIPGMDNDTPLHDAVDNYRLDVVKLLVSRGASITTRNMKGQTPLDLAQTDEMRQALNTPVSAGPSQTDVPMTPCEQEYLPLCFLGTALSRDQGRTLHKCASLLHAKVVGRFVPEVTHVITSCNRQGQCPRTLKFLNAVLGGKWILSVEWLDLCLEYKQKVCEEAFEVPGPSTKPDSHAATKGRLNRRQQLPGLFDGCQFYFYGSFHEPTPHKEDLQTLVKSAGGKIISREPKLQNIDDYDQTVPYHAESTSALKDCSVFIIHDKRVSYPAINLSRMCVLPANWIMDSIASFRLCDPAVM
ncbi:BRCA1-associated RING domain protein 1-like isoform X2 [Haliotis rubra]|uniref:BRCA1-associated RING domain protein 1-like isoform X2 n=1 Tax=Haliotis rubra TaxID=36100 RepID=UPI001EE581CB|nr:BRCA1-associated RING domain protein 1-like isoform X2 [Haliotis rubra]